MSRMKTFLMYLLMLVGFMFLSFVLENGLIDNMYEALKAKSNSGSYNIAITESTGRASNVNGYINFKLRNESSNTQNCYATINLYSKRGLTASTKYVEIFNFEPGEIRNYEVRFKANEVASYDISLVSTIPDKTNIINVLGWEIDLSNVFGMDLSNLKIFGIRVAELFTWDNVKTAGSNAWGFFKVAAASVPWWGYAIGASIILWYMPKGFLFGVFPF